MVKASATQSSIAGQGTISWDPDFNEYNGTVEIAGFPYRLQAVETTQAGRKLFRVRFSFVPRQEVRPLDEAPS